VHNVWSLSDRTRITLAPGNMTVNVSTTVELECRADTDDRELSSLTIRWFKDGLALSRNRDPRLRVDHVVGTLRLSDAQVYDTGSYQCVAGTHVDTDNAYAQLIVKGIDSTLSTHLNINKFSANLLISLSALNDICLF